MKSQVQAGMTQHAEPAKQIAVTRILHFVAILEIAGLINPFYDKISFGPTFYSIEIVVIVVCFFALYYAFSRRNKRDMKEVIKTNLNLFRIIAVALIPNAIALVTQ
jgi:chromate transport protein ChrA